MEGERCLVVGAGPVAARKAKSLLECGARVTVVAPEVSEAMEMLAAEHLPPLIDIEPRPYDSGEVAGYRLAITATGVPEVDTAVYLDGEKLGVWVNAADKPDACAFVLPAVLRRGDVSVAVSTGGLSPFMAGWVKRRVSTVVDEDVAVLARIVGAAREAVREGGVATEGLEWSELVDGELWPLVAGGDREGAEAAAAAWAAGVVARDSSEGRHLGGAPVAEARSV